MAIYLSKQRALGTFTGPCQLRKPCLSWNCFSQKLRATRLVTVSHRKGLQFTMVFTDMHVTVTVLDSLTSMSAHGRPTATPHSTYCPPPFYNAAAEAHGEGFKWLAPREMASQLQRQCCFDLASVSQWLELWLIHQRILGLILSQGHILGLQVQSPGRSGHVQEAAIDVSLTLMFLSLPPLPSFYSLKINGKNNLRLGLPKENK